MREMSRRGVLAAGATVLGIAALPALAQGGRYRLLVEKHVDMLCVGRLTAARFGPPVSTGMLSNTMLDDPTTLARVADTFHGERTIVIANPTLVAALSRLARAPRRAAPGLAEDIRRVLPADRVEVAVFA